MQTDRNTNIMKANTGCTRLVTDYFIPPLQPYQKKLLAISQSYERTQRLDTLKNIRWQNDSE
jgi:hypothetical protein